MSTRDVEEIVRRLERIEQNQAEYMQRADARLNDHGSRLRHVELWQARLEGVQIAVGKVPVLVSIAGALAGIAAVIVALV